MSNPRSRAFPNRRENPRKNFFQKNAVYLIAGGAVAIAVIGILVVSGGSSAPRDVEVTSPTVQRRPSTPPPTATPGMASTPSRSTLTVDGKDFASKSDSNTEGQTPEVKSAPDFGSKTGSGSDARKMTSATTPLIAPFDSQAATQAQKDWALHLGSKVHEQNSIGMKLVLIPSGTFAMGMSESELNELETVQKKVTGEYMTAADELESHAGVPAEHFAASRPVHTVTISRPIYMSELETTRENYTAFIDDSNYASEAGGKRRYGISGYNPKFTQTKVHPIVRVSWSDAQAFCEWLSAKEKCKYRLPTEAEWEFACRAGANTLWSHGNEYSSLQSVGNVGDAIRDTVASRYSPRAQAETVAGFIFLDGYLHTAPVGQYKPNPFGLYDMHGNVWEWCSDGFDSQYYKSSPASNPPGSSAAASRSLRGGSWYNTVRSSICCCRRELPPGSLFPDVGFRVVREIEPQGGVEAAGK